MANVLTVVWFVIGYAVMNACLLVWAAMMLPKPVERARQRLERQPVASFFLGLTFTVITVFISVALISAAKHGALQLLGWITAGPTLAAAVVGSAAFSRIVAGRLVGEMKNGSPIMALAGGAVCTTLAALLPVAGWFVFLPLVGMMSVGAGMLGIFSKVEVANAQAWSARRPNAAETQWPQGMPSYHTAPAIEAATAPAQPEFVYTAPQPVRESDPGAPRVAATA